MIVDKQLTAKNDKRVIEIDEDAIKIGEDIQFFAILSVGISRDEEGNYVYGLNVVSSEDELEMPSGEKHNPAETFIRRALFLMTNEMERNSEQEKEEQKQKDKPN